MRKVYNFKKLTEKVKQIAVLMLMLVMTAGSLFAEEVTFVFAEAGFTNGQVLPNGDINGIISYSADQQGSSTDGPKYYNSGAALRFYPGSNNTQGNAMILTPAFGYQITGLTINALSSYSPEIGYVVDGGEAVLVEADEELVYTISDIEAISSLKFYNAGTSQLRITSITITYTTAEVPAVAVPTFSPEPGIQTLPINVSLTCATPGALIYYTFNDSEFYLPYDSMIAVNATTTIHAFAVLGGDTSAIAHAHFVFPQSVNLYGFKHGVPGSLYMIQSENEKLDFVFRDGRNLYFMAEQPVESKGLLVYDNNPAVITTTFEEGESVDMLMGTLAFYNGIPELIPVTNPGLAENSTPHSVVPLQVTVAELLANPEKYISALVAIHNGQFQAGTFTTNSKTGVNFVQGTDTIVIYNNFKKVSATFEGGEIATVVGLVGMYNGVPQIYPRGNNDIVRPQVPYSCSFEGSESYAWTKVNGNANNWYIGNANDLFDNNKMYVSSVLGMNNVYNANIAAVSHAYIDITLPESDVLLSFDCRSKGNAEDFLQVSIMEDAPMPGILPENYLERYYNVNEFTRKTILIPASYAGNKKIVFTWRNDGSVGNQPPAAIDNVTIETTCSMVSNITATVENHTAVVTWDYPEGQNAWTLQYKAADADAWQSVNTTTPSVTLNNLSTETTYDVRVRSNCETASSSWKEARFTVPCIVLTSALEEINIGTGTTYSYISPMNAYYGNSWTQMIYPASSFSSAGYINSLSWEVYSANAHDYNSLKIYLGTTSMDSHQNTTSWLPMDELTLVYESYNGTIGSAAGWETYVLNNPFYYNGEDNLVVVTSRAANGWKALNYYYSAVNNSCLYRRADGNASYAEHPGDASGNLSGNLPNMKIDYLGYVCGDAHCAVPAEVNVNNITTTSATVSWAAGEANAWKVSYKGENDEEWTTTSVTTNQYELTGLEQNTDYEVRIMTDCGVLGMSNEAVVAFTTTADCPAPTDLSVTYHIANSVFSWIPVPGVNIYELQVAKAGATLWMPYLVSNASSFAISGLTEGETYNARVRSVCDAVEGEYSDWTELTFVRPAFCTTPTGLTVNDITQSGATISWDTLEANSWTVQYGVAGFILGEGTQMVTSSPQVLLVGLEAQTTYDVYVRANCGIYPSDWSSVFSFTTSCDLITITESDPWEDDFEGYHGSGAIGIGDCWDRPVTANANNGVFPSVYVGYSGSTYSGQNSVEFKGANNMLVLPAFSNAMNTLEMSFWANTTAYSAATAGTMELGVITDVNDPTTFVLVEEIPATAFNRTGQDAPHANFVGPISFASVTPQPGQRIAMRYANPSYSTQSWNLDNFTVSIIQDCHVPTDVTVNDIKVDSANVSWAAGGEETTWQFQYGLAGFVPGLGTVLTIDTNFYVLTDLSENTAYDVYVKAVCDENTTSVWAGPYTFTTAQTPGPEPTPCAYPTNLVVSQLTDSTATLTWSGDTATTYKVFYGSQSANMFAMVTVTGTEITLTNLTPEKMYSAYVQALCDSADNYSNEVTFFLTQFTLSCNNYTISEENRTENNMPVNNYYKNSYSQQIFYPSEVGINGTIDKISYNYAHTSASTKKNNVKIYLGHTNKSTFAGSNDWVTEGLVQVYEGSLNCEQGWNEFELDETFDYNGIDNLIVAVEDNSNDYDGNAFKFYQTNTTQNQAISWQNDYSTWNASNSGSVRSYRSDIRFHICSSATDIAVTSINKVPNVCDMSNVPVVVTLLNVGEAIEANTPIDMYYSVNGAAPVHETFLSSEGIEHAGTFQYQFTASANLTDPSNVITVWVELPGDGNVHNNMLNSDVLLVVEPATVPFLETFNEGEVHDSWINYSSDNSGFVMNDTVQGVTISDGTYNNSVVGADNVYTISPCMYIAAGRYDVSYSYKAADQAIPESFEVYLFTKSENGFEPLQQVSTEVFSNTNMVRAHNYITVAEDGVYYFAIRSASSAQHIGFSIDNFAVKAAINFTVTYAEHGTGTPEGLVECTEGEPYTLTIFPESGYHVSAIYNNMQLVSGESEDIVSVEYFTFIPQNNDNIYVTFASSNYVVNATVANLYNTEYNDNAPGATYAPNHEMVAYGGSHTGLITLAENYHICSVTVNGLNVTQSLVPVNENQYLLTINNIVENKNVHVVAGLDSTTIVYTVLAGEGTINNEIVVDASTELPAVYTVTLPGYSDLLSTITPAPGYYVSSIIVDGVEHNIIDMYSFEHLFGYHTVTVVFSKNHYTITTSAYGNGTVSEGAEFEYDPDYVYNFVATPAEGYRIATILRNNVEIPVANPAVPYTETLTNITTDYVYEVHFAQNTFTVSAASGIHGTVSPAGVTYYFYNQDAVYEINAEPGYFIASVTIDGETSTYTQADALTSFTTTFAQISEDHTISATFAQMMFTVTMDPVTNGNITIPGNGSYPYGATPTCVITPNEGYVISDVIVDGESVGAVTSYTFTPLASNHTIGATFSAALFTITATAGNGGNITPSGVTNMGYNGSQSYTISANAGYHISDVFVDGISVGAVSSYSFNNVTANHSIYAAFEANEYTITVTQPANGVITPGTTTVANGATPTFVFTPAVGYTVSAITVNGTNVISNATNLNDIYTYVFPAVTANQTLTATMTAKTFTISATAGANGTITPNGNTTVYFGNTQAYNITPANGYVVDNVVVDGMNLGALTSYVFTNVVANHTINVTFRLADCDIPTFLYTSHIDSTSAELHWSHPTATSFDIQYKTPTGTATTVPAIAGTSYLLTDLTPGTTYLWQVRANCSANNHSEWSNMISFTTQNTVIDETGIEDLVKSIKVYAEHQNVHILNNEGLNIDNVRIFDAYGKLIYSGTVSSEHEVIGLTVAAGTYIVNVTTDKGVANYKVTIVK